MSKSFQIWDHSIVLLFPKDSKNLKSCDIALHEVGEKKMFIRSEQKVWRTDKHTDISTLKKESAQGADSWKIGVEQIKFLSSFKHNMHS